MAPDHTITLDDSTFQSLLAYLRKNDKVDLLNALIKTPQATQIPSMNAMTSVAGAAQLELNELKGKVTSFYRDVYGYMQSKSDTKVFLDAIENAATKESIVAQVAQFWHKALAASSSSVNGLADFAKHAYLLKDLNIDLNESNANGCNLLLTAAQWNNGNVWDSLIECGANATHTDADGNNAFDYALKDSAFATGMKALEYFPDQINKKNKINGATISHLAAYVGSAQEIQSCLDKGAFLNAIGFGGVGMLHCAIEGRNEDALLALLKAGADPLLKNAEGLTAIELNREISKYPNSVEFSSDALNTLSALTQAAMAKQEAAKPMGAKPHVMKTFEVTAMGFDGSSDETDDRVFWVKAPSAEEVKSAIEGTSARFHDQIDCDSDIDFELPAQVAELREALMQFEHGSHPVAQQIRSGGQRGMRRG